MKLSIALGTILLLFSSCLKHDILKQDATGNFKKSEFYESGDFENLFDVIIEDLVVEQYVGGNGNQFCKPVFKVRLTEAYVQKLEQNWDFSIRLTVSENRIGDVEESIQTYNFRELLPVEKRKGIECGYDKVFRCELEIVSPNNSAIVLGFAEKEIVIQTP